jgi:hypothetical protein
MKLTDEEMKALYQQHTARSAQQRSACLSAEALMRAATGAMDQSERERVADHMMTCSDCAEEYRLIHSLKPWAPQAVAAATRQATEMRLQKQEGASTLRPGWWPWLRMVFSPVQAPYALAVSLLIVSLVLGAWIVSLYRENQRIAARLNEQLAEANERLAAATGSLEKARQQLDESPGRSEQYETQIAELRQNISELSQTVDELSQPQINVPITDLDPQDSARGERSGRVTTIQVPEGANIFTLILNIASEQKHASYGLEIVDERGKIVWRGQGLQKSQSDNFTIALARRLLPAGRYRIKLYGLRGGQRELVEDYAVRVQYQ